MQIYAIFYEPYLYKLINNFLSLNIRINNQIQAPELRVLLDDGTNLGIISFKEALDKARELGLDLLLISPNATPPVAKIMDYGKFQYAENKKTKTSKSKAHTV